MAATKVLKLPDPAAIPTLVAANDAAKVQATIRAKYGFEASLEYCRDLIAFVEAMLHETRFGKRNMVRWEPSSDALICSKCGKLMTYYLEEDRLTPGEWHCGCGHMQYEMDPELYEQELERHARTR